MGKGKYFFTYEEMEYLRLERKPQGEYLKTFKDLFLCFSLYPLNVSDLTRKLPALTWGMSIIFLYPSRHPLGSTASLSGKFHFPHKQLHS